MNLVGEIDYCSQVGSVAVATLLSGQRILEFVEDGAYFLARKTGSNENLTKIAAKCSAFQFSRRGQFWIGALATPGMLWGGGKALLRLATGRSEDHFGDSRACVDLLLGLGSLLLFRGTLKSPLLLARRLQLDHARRMVAGLNLLFDGIELFRLRSRGGSTTDVALHMWFMAAFNLDRGGRTMFRIKGESMNRVDIKAVPPESKTGTEYFRQVVAAEYDEEVRNMIHDYDAMQEGIFDAIPFGPQAKIKILDLGMGTGNLTELLLKRFPNATVTAVELSPDMIQLAGKKLRRFGNRLQIVEGDFTKVPLPEAEYDVIASCMSLHHIASPAEKTAYYARLRQALKPGGVLSLSDPIKGENKYLDERYRGKMIEYIKAHYRHAEWLLQHEREEDFPERVSDHLKWLVETGYKNPHLVWQRWNYAVIAAEA